MIRLPHAPTPPSAPAAETWFGQVIGGELLQVTLPAGWPAPRPQRVRVTRDLLAEVSRLRRTHWADRTWEQVCAYYGWRPAFAAAVALLVRNHQAAVVHVPTQRAGIDDKAAQEAIRKRQLWAQLALDRVELPFELVERYLRVFFDDALPGVVQLRLELETRVQRRAVPLAERSTANAHYPRQCRKVGLPPAVMDPRDRVRHERYLWEKANVVRALTDIAPHWMTHPISNLLHQAIAQDQQITTHQLTDTMKRGRKLPDVVRAILAVKTRGEE